MEFDIHKVKGTALFLMKAYKIDCGKAHFDSIGVNFKDVTSIYELISG